MYIHRIPGILATYKRPSTHTLSCWIYTHIYVRACIAGHNIFPAFIKHPFLLENVKLLNKERKKEFFVPHSVQIRIQLSKKSFAETNLATVFLPTFLKIPYLIYLDIAAISYFPFGTDPRFPELLILCAPKFNRSRFWFAYDDDSSPVHG